MMQPTVMLNDGWTMPRMGQGAFDLPEGETARIVREGIDAGYRAVDTAAIYRNEAGVGEGVRGADSTVFVTTKLWNSEQGRDRARRAFDASFAKLGLDWIDLYLIHWPVPSAGLFVETWATLVELRGEGRVRSIGVSNFTISQLRRIIDETGVVPAVNQIELHPAFPQNELVAFHEAHGIATTSWSPLGQGKLLGQATLGAIADKHHATPAQVILAWHLARGLIAIPKASNAARLRENFAAADLRLDCDDVAGIATMARPDGRIGPDPATASFGAPAP